MKPCFAAVCWPTKCHSLLIGCSLASQILRLSPDRELHKANKGDGGQEASSIEFDVVGGAPMPTRTSMSRGTPLSYV